MKHGEAREGGVKRLSFRMQAMPVFGLRIGGMAATLALQVYLARILDPEQFGLFAIANSLLIIAAVPGRLGCELGSVKYLPSYLETNRHDLYVGYMTFAARTSLISSGLIAMLLSTIIWIGWRLGAGWAQNAVFLAVLTLPILVRLQVYVSELRALQKPVASMLPETVLRPVLIGICMVVLMLAIEPRPTATLVMGVGLSATFLALIIAGWQVRARRRELGIDSPATELRTQWWSAVLPLALMSGAEVIDSRSDVLLIGWLASTESAGIYSVAIRVTALMALTQNVANLVAAPIISAAHARSDKAAMQKAVGEAAVLSLMSALPIAVVMLTGASFVLSIFGPEFVVGIPALQILVLAQLVIAFSGVGGYLLSMTGHHIPIGRIMIVGAVMNITLNILLIPTYGMLGAAIATLMSACLRSGSMVWISHTRLGIDPTFLGFFKSQRAARP